MRCCRSLARCRSLTPPPAHQIESVLDSWGAFPQACSGMYRSNMDFFFLYNRLPDAVVDRLKQKLATSAAYKHISGCFSRTGIAYANLTGEISRMQKHTLLTH